MWLLQKSYGKIFAGLRRTVIRKLLPLSDRMGDTVNLTELAGSKPAVLFEDPE